MNRALPLLLLTVMAASACASPRGTNRDEGPSSIRIEVRNFNFNDATLHALRGTERIRLGIVTGKSDRSFEVEWRFSRPLRIEIDLLAADSCITRERMVDPGEVVELQIAVVLSMGPDCNQSSASTSRTMTSAPAASVQWTARAVPLTPDPERRHLGPHVRP